MAEELDTKKFNTQLLDWVVSLNKKYNQELISAAISQIQEWGKHDTYYSRLYRSRKYGDIPIASRDKAKAEMIAFDEAEKKVTTIISKEDFGSLKTTLTAYAAAHNSSFSKASVSKDLAGISSSDLPKLGHINGALNKYGNIIESAIAKAEDKAAKTNEIKRCLQDISAKSEGTDDGFLGSLDRIVRSTTNAISGKHIHSSEVEQKQSELIIALSNADGYSSQTQEHYQYDASVIGEGNLARQLLDRIDNAKVYAAAKAKASPPDLDAKLNASSQPGVGNPLTGGAATPPGTATPNASATPPGGGASPPPAGGATDAAPQVAAGPVDASDLDGLIDEWNNGKADDFTALHDRIEELQQKLPQLKRELVGLKLAIKQKTEEIGEIGLNNGQESVFISTGASQALMALRDAEKADGSLDLADASRLLKATTIAVSSETVDRDTHSINDQMLAAIGQARESGADAASIISLADSGGAKPQVLASAGTSAQPGR